MLAQAINVGSPGSGTGLFFRKSGILVVSCIALFLSACMPIGNQEINTTLFKSKEDMKMRAAELKPGMSKEAVFEQISIAPENFSHMSTPEVQMSIYGNSMVQGSPEQLEQFKQRLMSYEGYSLPYREIKSSGSLGFGTMKVNKSGYDLKLVLIFEKDHLLRASVDGNQEVNQDENQYLWNALLRKSTGVGF
jgi:hypothetical protein